MTRDEIIMIAWDCGILMGSHKFQEGPTKLEQFAERIAAAEREKVAAWMRSKSYATGHGDTIEDLLKELEWQVAEREREVCAKVCEELGVHPALNVFNGGPEWYKHGKDCAAAIRARGEQEEPR